jgi:hypothetical protein
MALPVKNYPRSKFLPELPTSMQFYTIAEVAIILETKVGLIHEWIQKYKLPALQFGSEQHILRIRAQVIRTDHGCIVVGSAKEQDGLFKFENKLVGSFLRVMS